MLVTTITEVMQAEVETAPLIVAPNVPLARSLADNTIVVAAPKNIVRSTLPVTKLLESLSYLHCKSNRRH